MKQVIGLDDAARAIFEAMSELKAPHAHLASDLDDFFSGSRSELRSTHAFQRVVPLFCLERPKMNPLVGKCVVCHENRLEI